MPAQQVAILAAEFDGIAGIEVGRLVQILMAAPRGVGADAADASSTLLPRSVSSKCSGWAQLIM